MLSEHLENEACHPSLSKALSSRLPVLPMSAMTLAGFTGTAACSLAAHVASQVCQGSLQPPGKSSPCSKSFGTIPRSASDSEQKLDIPITRMPPSGLNSRGICIPAAPWHPTHAAKRPQMACPDLHSITEESHSRQWAAGAPIQRRDKENAEITSPDRAHQSMTRTLAHRSSMK